MPPISPWSSRVDVAKPRPHGPQAHVASGHEVHKVFVRLLTGIPQLSHVAQNERGDHGDSSLKSPSPHGHAGGIGIVGIQQHPIVVGHNTCERVIDGTICRQRFHRTFTRLRSNSRWSAPQSHWPSCSCLRGSRGRPELRLWTKPQRLVSHLPNSNPRERRQSGLEHPRLRDGLLIRGLDKGGAA